MNMLAPVPGIGGFPLLARLNVEKRASWSDRTHEQFFFSSQMKDLINQVTDEKTTVSGVVYRGAIPIRTSTRVS
jgi:hypothetical protein